MLNKTNQISFKPTFAVLFIIALFILMTQKEWRFWKKGDTPFKYDMDQYYSYLPAAFLHHDLSFRYTERYWLMKAENGGMVAKGTCGMALMEAPFFLLGHEMAKKNNEALDGYSPSYARYVHFGSLLYVLLGLFILRQILIRYFNEWISALALFSVFFCTNYFNYAVNESEMAHSYLFFLVAAFTLLTIKWYENPKIKFIIPLAFVFGLITLIRPTEIILVIIFAGYGVFNKEMVKERLGFLLKYKWQIILFGVISFMVWVPQMIYWKTFTDKYLFFSYGSEERFFFNDPQIMNVLFSYRKGWLLYTPLMIFALLGMVQIKRRAINFSYVLPIYFLLNLYLISCWWSWWYGGSFGMRSLIHVYPLLAIPLAAFLDRIFKLRIHPVFKSSFRYAAVGAVFFCFILNMMQTIQYKKKIIHYDSMTKEAYWLVYGKLELTDEENKLYWELLKAPNNLEAQKGNRDQ